MSRTTPYHWVRKVVETRVYYEVYKHFDKSKSAHYVIQDGKLATKTQVGDAQVQVVEELRLLTEVEEALLIGDAIAAREED